MKKLLVLTLIILGSIGSYASNLEPLKGLVDHTWKLELKQLLGGDNIIQEITFTKGARDNVINFKTKWYDLLHDTIVPFSEGTIVYNNFTYDVYFSETYYLGDLMFGSYAGGDASTFTRTTSGAMEPTEHFYITQEVYTKVDDYTYNVVVYIYQGQERLESSKGTLTLIR